MAEPFLSRFTPSLMSAEALEAIFVQREPLAQRLVDLIRESVASRSSQHTLLIGPRGIGKTHMVALVYHRLRKDEELGDHLLVAWLREEEWGVGSFLDLLIRILLALRAEYGESGLEDLKALYELVPAEAERRAADLLVQFLGGRPMLVIAENLDEIFAGLGSAEQRRLRAFLQEHNLISLLATSQSLFNGVSLQSSPFYGFFRIHHLDELDFQDAIRLLVQIAEFTGKSDLVASLQTTEGRARIRAVHHLAGGNPRIYIIFSQFLTRESLEELVDPFMRLLDDLTPYYQARMAWISPQQRKIVDFLCDRRGAVAVKEIAKHCFVSHQTISSQLKDLKETGYVRSVALGRESFYELREPLMRLCMEVKRHRGESIGSLIDFLRWWYSGRELQARLESSGLESLDREYILQALQLKSSDAEAAEGFMSWRASAARELLEARELSSRMETLLTNSPGDALRLRMDPMWMAVRAALIGLLIMTHQEEDAKTLVEQAKQGKLLSLLGLSLIQKWYVLGVPKCDEARNWLKLWARIAANEEELKVPLRLLEVWQRFLENRDDRILLELPWEERLLVEFLLEDAASKIPPEEGTSKVLERVRSLAERLRSPQEAA